MARADDGALDVRDAYVHDTAAGVWSRPAGDPPPSLPPTAPYAAVPWELTFDGDTLYKKPAWRKTLKMFLVKAVDRDTDRLDLTTVVVLDAAKRSVTRGRVTDRTTTDDPHRTWLRIR